MTSFYREILIIVIAGIIILILGFLLAAIARRILNARKYVALDAYRDLYRQKISDALQSGTVAVLGRDMGFRPLSLQWRAIEDVLFEQMARGTHVTEIRQLFLLLGYRDHYESRLKSRRTIAKASAVDKLGKMQSVSSTASLVKILTTEKEPEILTVTVRALCRIGNPEGLKGILDRLPEMYAKSLVSQKTVDASLISFREDAVPVLVEYGGQSSNPKVKATLLAVLSRLPASASSLAFAAANLSAQDPEVRARAIRVFGRHGASPGGASHPGLLLPLLQDPVWFVRLQAARALENLRYKKGVGELGALLLDPNWQVRNAAARALANIGDASLDVFLNILQDRDRYAKESVCEEAERTYFNQWLIANLASSDTRVYEKSRGILKLMHRLNFSTPLREYLENGVNDTIKREIMLLMQETFPPSGAYGARGTTGEAGVQGDGKKA